MGWWVAQTNNHYHSSLSWVELSWELINTFNKKDTNQFRVIQWRAVQLYTVFSTLYNKQRPELSLVILILHIIMFQSLMFIIWFLLFTCRVAFQDGWTRENSRKLLNNSSPIVAPQDGLGWISFTTKKMSVFSKQVIPLLYMKQVWLHVSYGPN